MSSDTNDANYKFDHFKASWNKHFSSNQIGSSVSEGTKKLLARFWAHMMQETGSGGAVNESGCPSDAKCCDYNTGTCTTSTDSNSKYFGRGSLQLSHKKNYKSYGSEVHANENKFVGNADELGTGTFTEGSETASYRMDSGIWYFKHANMHRCYSDQSEEECFAVSIMKINGNLECVNNEGDSNGKQAKRFGYWKDARTALGLAAAGDMVDCHTHCQHALNTEGVNCWGPWSRRNLAAATVKTAYENLMSGDPKKEKSDQNYPWDDMRASWNKHMTKDKIDSTTKLASVSEDTKKLLARFWAHMMQETGKGKYISESGCPTAAHCCDYNTDSCSSSTNSDKKYYGRGSLQLSWKDKYSAYGTSLGTESKFIDNADALAVQSSYRMDSGVWFFKHANMHRCYSDQSEEECFAVSIMKINGDLECGKNKGDSNGKQAKRFGYWKDARVELGLVAPGDMVDCHTHCGCELKAGKWDCPDCWGPWWPSY